MAAEVTPVSEPDTITRYAIYNTTLTQFVGGVSVGEPPSDAEVKRTLEAYDMKGHKAEVRQV